MTDVPQAEVDEAPSIDGRFRLTVADNGTSAFIERLARHSGNGKPVSVSDVLAKLKKLKVIHGIREDVIENIVAKLAEGVTPSEKVAIAEWEPPVEGTDASVKWLIDTSSRNVHQRYVIPGQLIAIKSPAVPGTPGKNIHGKAKQPRQRPAEIPLKAGDGVQMKTTREGTLEFSAKILGFVCTTGDAIYVKSAITVAEDGLDARMAIYPVSGGDSSTEVTVEHVMASIKTAAIKHGVNETRIRKLFERPDFHRLTELANPKPVPLPIASGDSVQDGQDGSIEWLVEPGTAESPAFVVPGQLLAVITSPTPTSDGKDVFGRVLKAQPGEVKTQGFDPDTVELLAVEERDELRARGLGQLIEDNGKLAIQCGLTISSDGLEARLELFAQSSGSNGEALMTEQVLECIQQAGIQVGIDEENIRKRLQQLVELPPDDKPSMPVVIARGTEPVPGVDAKLELDHKLTSGKLLPDGRIDFHEHSYPWNVSTGEVIGVYTPAVPQQDGQMVTGEAIAAREPKSLELELEGIVEKDDGALIAERGGSLLVAKNRLCVTDCVVVDGDVNQETGNVRAKAGVVINGFVMPGFIAESEHSDVIVKQNIEDATINARGNVIIHGGIRGENCKITSGNDVTTSFAEQAEIKAKGALTISKHSIGCDLLSNERITVGEKNAKKGGLIGGSAKGLSGIEANILGSDSYVKTLVQTGSLPETQDRLDELTDKAENKANELVTLDNILYQNRLNAAAKNEILERAQDTRDALLEEIDLINAELDILDESLQETGDSKIVVHYKSYPGVTIRICNKSLKIEREYGPGVFELKDDKISFTAQ